MFAWRAFMIRALAHTAQRIPNPLARPAVRSTRLRREHADDPAENFAMRASVPISAGKFA